MKAAINRAIVLVKFSDMSVYRSYDSSRYLQDNLGFRRRGILIKA